MSFLAQIEDTAVTNNSEDSNDSEEDCLRKGCHRYEL